MPPGLCSSCWGLFVGSDLPVSISIDPQRLFTYEAAGGRTGRQSVTRQVEVAFVAEDLAVDLEIGAGATLLPPECCLPS
jgi:hypothetical protein